MTSVAIVGAGFGGIGAAISLRRAGIDDVVVLGSSWYIDEQGRDPTNWPGYTLEYRRRVARISPHVYALDHSPAHAAVG